MKLTSGMQDFFCRLAETDKELRFDCQRDIRNELLQMFSRFGFCGASHFHNVTGGIPAISVYLWQRREDVKQR